jgi:hypothetical protein
MGTMRRCGEVDLAALGRNSTLYIFAIQAWTSIYSKNEVKVTINSWDATR